MTDYTQQTQFTPKDTLPTGNLQKLVKGEELDGEFGPIATAINSKLNEVNPVFTGTMLGDGIIQGGSY